MADILADAQRWLDSLAARNDDESAAQDAVWVIEQSIAEIERLRAIEAAARAYCAADAAYDAGDKTWPNDELALIDRMQETRAMLREALEKGGAK